VPNDGVGIEAFAVIREAMVGKGVAALVRVVLNKRDRVIALEPWTMACSARRSAALPGRLPTRVEKWLGQNMSRPPAARGRGARGKPLVALLSASLRLNPQPAEWFLHWRW
jgi:hypothetical protein